MFETLGEFSAVYFALAAVLVLLVLFKKPLIALEDRIRLKEDVVRKQAKIIEVQKGTISDQKEILAIQDKIIDFQNRKITKLRNALSTQKKINSINLETLRQERLMRAKENNNGKDR